MRMGFGVQRCAEALRRHRWLVAAMTFAAAGVALATSLSRPPVYEATAMVVLVRPPAYLLNPEIKTATNNVLTTAGCVQLAVSDDVLRALQSQLKPVPNGAETLGGLRSLLSARRATDPFLVRLVARSRKPGDAARIVNTWAELLVTGTNDLFDRAGRLAQEGLKRDLEQARADLERADEESARFKAADPSVILQARQEALEGSLRALRAELSDVERTLQEADALRKRLDAAPADEAVPVPDALAVLSLQARATGNTQVILQLTSLTSDAPVSRAKLTADIVGALATLTERRSLLSAAVAEGDSELGSLQQQLSEIALQRGRLDRAQQVAAEECLALERGIDEEQIAAQRIHSELALASRAAVPQAPAYPLPVLTTTISAVAGLLLGVLFALWLDRHSPQPTLASFG